MDYPAERDIR